LTENESKLVETMFENARKGIFLQKEFLVENKNKKYCSYLFFTKSEINLPKADMLVAYKCKRKKLDHIDF
jgi:hypothetical protein